MKALKITFISLFLLFSCYLMAVNEHPPKYEYRGVWVTTIENLDWPRTRVVHPSDTLLQQRELVQLLDSLHSLNVNTVLLQARVRGDVIYPSSIEPYSHVLTGVEGKSPGYDALAFAVRECHKRGMQLHAWVVTFPLGKDEHIKRMGRLSLPRKNSALCTHYNGNWYMEPGNPATAQYLCRLASEITANYDIDGLHLDYVRYPDRTNGYPDSKLHSKHGKGKPLAAWRRANVTHVVREVYKTVKAIKPWVRVTCAPLGKYSDLASYSSYGWDAYNAVFQEAQEWVREGIMDALFPMLYFKGNNFYPFVLDWQENACGRHIAPGVGVYRLLPEYGGWSALEIKRQLLTSRSAGTAGSLLFRARHLYENAGGAADVYASVYKYPAFVPPMDWNDAPLPATPPSFVAERSGAAFSLSWGAVEQPQGHPATKYNVYASVGDSATVDAVEDVICAGTHSLSFKWNCFTSKAVSFAVTAVDAFGRESAPACYYFSAAEEPAELLLPAPHTWGMRLGVYDAYGRTVYSGRYSMQLSVGGLPAGYYLITVMDRDGVGLSTRWYLKR